MGDVGLVDSHRVGARDVQRVCKHEEEQVGGLVVTHRKHEFLTLNEAIEQGGVILFTSLGHDGERIGEQRISTCKFILAALDRTERTVHSVTANQQYNGEDECYSSHRMASSI